MPRTRRGANLAQETPVRLSDFFPDENAPSPILARTSPLRAMQDATACLCPPDLYVRKSIRKKSSPIKSQKAHVNGTPRFDPDIHGADLDASLDSEDEFVQSLTFSAAKCKPVERIKVTSKPYTIVHDYNSDDDDIIGLSPVKFSPVSHKQSIRSINGTPAPSRSTKATTRMVWNSTKKKVVPRLVEDMRTKSYHWSSSNPKQAASPDHAMTEELCGTRSSQCHDMESFSRPKIRPALAISAKKLQTSSTKNPNDPTVHQSLANASTPVENSADQNRDFISATRSPKVLLTRTMPGSRSTQTLEKLELPDFVAQTAETTIGRRANQRLQPYARLPKQKPTVSHGAMDASRMIEQLDVRQKEASANKDISSGFAKQDESASSTEPSRKRKLSETRPDIINRDMPSKRVRRIADEGLSIESDSKMNKAAHDVNNEKPGRISENIQHESKLAELSHEQPKHKKDLGLGYVPRSLYVPQRNTRIHSNSKTVTKAAPFQFATASRSERSPALRRTSTKQPIASAHRPNKVRALYLDPFVPKPSEQAHTVACSPMRAVPTRLETRREFNKVADEHAKQASADRRRELEIIAMERERAIEARKGWSDAGKNAVEEWRRSRTSELGKRPGWQD